jgi:hypothetical protein
MKRNTCPSNILRTLVTLKSTKSTQAPNTFIALNVLPKQVLLFHKLHTKKYLKNIFFDAVQHF